MVTYKLIRSNRRTIQIQILPDKTIEVRAPKNVSDTRISSFVTSKENWINKKLQEKKEVAQIPINHFYVVGETFYYRGKQYVLKSGDESVKKSSVYLSGNNLIIQTRQKTPEAFQSKRVPTFKLSQLVSLALRASCKSQLSKLYAMWTQELIAV